MDKRLDRTGTVLLVLLQRLSVPVVGRTDFVAEVQPSSDSFVSFHSGRGPEWEARPLVSSGYPQSTSSSGIVTCAFQSTGVTFFLVVNSLFCGFVRVCSSVLKDTKCEV